MPVSMLVLMWLRFWLASCARFVIETMAGHLYMHFPLSVCLAIGCLASYGCEVANLRKVSSLLVGVIAFFWYECSGCEVANLRKVDVVSLFCGFL